MIKNIEPTFQLNQKLSFKKKEQKEPYELTNKRKNERGINVDYQTIWRKKNNYILQK